MSQPWSHSRFQHIPKYNFNNEAASENIATHTKQQYMMRAENAIYYQRSKIDGLNIVLLLTS